MKENDEKEQLFLKEITGGFGVQILVFGQKRCGHGKLFSEETSRKTLRKLAKTRIFLPPKSIRKINIWEHFL